MTLDGKTILVTGGAGFVGSCLVRELLAQSRTSKIAVLDSFVNGRREYLPKSARLTLWEADLTDKLAMEKLVRDTGPDVVFHLAAIHFIPYCNAHPAEALQVNVVGTQNLLEALRAKPAAKLIIASSAAVYPIRDNANEEENAVGPTDIYGLTKWTNEKQLELFAQQVQTQCAAARLFNVFGPNETNPHVIPEILDQMVRGQTEIALGNIKPKRDYVYVTDVAKALMTIAERNEHSYRTYNVGTGAEYSVEEIIDELVAISGRRLDVVVASDRVRSADRMHLLCDRARITSELGWRPQHDLKSGLTALWRSVEKASAVEDRLMVTSV